MTLRTAAWSAAGAALALLLILVFGFGGFQTNHK